MLECWTRLAKPVIPISRDCLVIKAWHEDHSEYVPEFEGEFGRDFFLKMDFLWLYEVWASQGKSHKTSFHYQEHYPINFRRCCPQAFGIIFVCGRIELRNGVYNTSQKNNIRILRYKCGNHIHYDPRLWINELPKMHKSQNLNRFPVPVQVINK